ncbi:MAG: hypothetical protein GY915_05985, partial [bacterium]|nr:hypothetical protein [bacterium]
MMLIHIWKGLKWAFLVPIVVCTILVAALFVRLSFGPMSLNFLDTYIEHSLSTAKVQYRVTVETSTISWNRSQGTLDLNVSDLRVFQKGESVGHLPKATVQWSINDLIAFNFNRAELDIHNLSFALPQGMFEGNGSLETLNFPAQDLVLWGLKRFSRVELLHMRLFSGGKSAPLGQVNARLSWPSGQKSWSGEASIQEVDLENLAPLFEGEKKTIFEGLQTPATANILVRGSGTSFSKAQVSVSLGEGRLALTPYLETQYDVASGLFKVEVTPEKAVLKEAALTLKRGEMVHISGELTHFDAPKIELNVQVETVQVNHLPDLWPKSLGTVSHTWVQKNLHQGRIPKATLKLGMDWKEERFQLSHLSGTIEIEGTNVRYMDKVPSIDSVSAHIIYTDKLFTIRPIKGHTGSLSLKEGSVLTIS